MNKTIPILMTVLIAITCVSGCTAVDIVSETWCDTNGGTWIEDFGECCQRGCPESPIENPITASDRAIVERCSVCWLE